LNYVNRHKEENAKHFGWRRKKTKMKRKNFFLFWKKRKKEKKYLIFLLRFSKTFGLNKKAKFLALILFIFFTSFFFVFENNWNFFLLFAPYQKDL